MKLRVLLFIGFGLIVFSTGLTISQNAGDVVINEIMYAPTPAANEWFELYNNTASAVNLANWKWKDATATLRTITTQNIDIPASGFAVVCQDSAAFRAAYPAFTGLLLQPTNGWSVLNNTGDQLVLFTGTSLVMDSINFTSSWGGSTGSRSLERISSTAPTNQQSNWGTSIAAAGATPNLRNSISPVENDLSLNILSFNSNSPLIGTTLQITANVKNRGSLAAPSYTVSFYEDYNRDSIPTPNELIVTQNSAGALAPGDSANYITSDLLDSLGNRQYIAVVTYAPDEDTLNNKRTGSVNVVSAGGFDSLIVNEIMYAPTAGTGEEWFELYNKSSSPVNLQNWKWKDATATIQTITTQPVFIPAGGFVVVCQDSNSVKSFYPQNTGIYLQSSGWSALNNTGDNLVLFNSTGIVIDSLTFTSAWGGSTGNRSLERISYTAPSVNQTNWGTCISPAGATPNRVNSLTPKPHDLALNRITFSRTNPSIGDTLGIIAQIRNRGLNSAPSFTVSYYDDYNRDSIPTPNELNATLNSTAVLNPGDSANYTYNVILDSAGFRQYIAVVTYAPDEDTTNNKRAAGIEVAGGSTAGRVLINEIMYSLPFGESDWVELYNNSDSTVNLKNWKVQDNTSTQVVITNSDYFLNPRQYVVIAKDTTVFQKHPGLQSERVILNSNFPALNNTGGDAVIIYKIDGTLSDRVDFLTSWGGTTTSLERIDINGLSNNSINWTSSIDCERSTPARINSISSAVPYELYDLVVNEIMAAPLSGNAEWVELYNPTGKTINIAGWKYSETSTSKRITDTCEFLVKPGMYVVLAADSTIYTRYSYLLSPDSTQKVFIIGSLGLNNDADLVKITDVLKTKIDSVYYLDDWYNPNLPGSGRSLEKINPLLDPNDGRSWSSCTYPNGGSPGLRNSIFTSLQQATSEITVFPNPFSPDGDGHEDFTIISYKLNSSVSQVRMKIFDVKGRLIKTLLNNQTTGPEGQIVYNGFDDDNRKLRLGIYIIFLEALNDQNGVVETLKSTLVIGAKL